jgi:Transposase
VSGAKSDRVDALVLANLLRTDRDRHRRLPDDSHEVEAIAVLARAHQDAIWTGGATPTSVSDGLCTEVADETEVTDVVRRLGKEHRNVNTDERDERDDRLDWAVAAG